MPRIGQMNRLVTIKRNTATAAKNAYGEKAESFTDYMANVWAEVEPMDGSEIVRRGLTIEQHPVMIRVRWASGKQPKPTDRVVMDSDTYDVLSAPEENGRRRFWRIAAVKVA